MGLMCLIGSFSKELIDMARPTVKLQYPGKIAIRRAVEAARDNGINVAGIQVWPLYSGGAIELIDASVVATYSNSGEFEQWDAAGKL